MEEKNETIKLPEPSGHVPNLAETSSEVPQPSADFRTVPNHAEAFGKVPHDAERKESHTLTVREVARMFEAAGVARTERSIVNWCQPNRTGIARLDSYFDPNERRYYISPQSVEQAIAEEKAKVTKHKDSSESFGNIPQPVETAKQTKLQADEISDVTKLKHEIFDLRVTNHAKDIVIDRMQKERDGFFDQLLNANRNVGALEAKLLQIGTSTRLKE